MCSPPASYLDELSVAGECAAEYLALYQKLIKPARWKVYLAARGVLPYVGNLITKVGSRPLQRRSGAAPSPSIQLALQPLGGALRRLSPLPPCCIHTTCSRLQEIARLLALEEATLSTDLQQGYALKSITGMLSDGGEGGSCPRVPSLARSPPPSSLADLPSLPRLLCRFALLLRGGGVHQEALQEPAGGDGAERLPVPEEAGGAADQAD